MSSIAHENSATKSRSTTDLFYRKQTWDSKNGVGSSSSLMTIDSLAHRAAALLLASRFFTRCSWRQRKHASSTYADLLLWFDEIRVDAATFAILKAQQTPAFGARGGIESAQKAKQRPPKMLLRLEVKTSSSPCVGSALFGLRAALSKTIIVIQTPLLRDVPHTHTWTLP